jgi:4-diphosphocytidyl-2-C-methyl-D-erythritol kinase
LLLQAPAKLNLCLFLGPAREDGRHEIRSLFEPLSLADEIEVTEAPRDEVACPDVEGENLVAAALAELRKSGWDRPPLRIAIKKRIPVAGGLGGGSADAAAVLRLAEGEVDGIEAIAERLGADVPSQLRPSFSLISGAGEVVEPLPPAAGHAVVLMPQDQGLSTAAVYAEADRFGLGRDRERLEAIEGRLRDAADAGSSPFEYSHLLINDLEPAATGMHPGIEPALEALQEAGAARSLISGSGPTAFGLFADLDSAQQAAEQIDGKAIACEPLAR